MYNHSQGSYYLSGSNVSGYTSETVLSVERVPYSQLPYAYSSGGRTDEVLSYVTDRFGPVASFSGSYSADTWTLNIQRNTVPPGKTKDKIPQSACCINIVSYLVITNH